MNTHSLPNIPQGLLLWEGPTQFGDSAETIGLIATGFKTRSTNRKTGPLIQTYILKKDIRPSRGVKLGQDFAICGDCKHSGSKGKSCYVDAVSQGPNSIWDAWMRGHYKPINDDQRALIFVGEKIRLGAYGDPCAVPFEVWEPIIKTIKQTNGMWTGFTHAWKFCDQRFKDFLVASVDTPEELEQARELGWRTFRTMAPGEEPLKNEFICPASDAGYEKLKRKVTCEQCGACNGLADRPQRGSACIEAHGAAYKINNYVKLRLALSA